MANLYLKRQLFHPFHLLVDSDSSNYYFLSLLRFMYQIFKTHPHLYTHTHTSLAQNEVLLSFSLIYRQCPTYPFFPISLANGVSTNEVRSCVATSLCTAYINTSHHVHNMYMRVFKRIGWYRKITFRKHFRI